MIPPCGAALGRGKA
ncbi:MULTISPECIES: IlvGEDA operon leader peptide [Enterobacteriaceae]|nr:IlvGEDA operon leader peptide [Enterobacter sp.]MDU4985693.1 IlvGEDA operon leader peptide [Enterobacter sp.]